ncbi:hypothetical protein A1OE_1512 [Candidatus Endolissoclinum faulkneri L2]|uniref:Uncharacterized protein n=1 Tax=Candidatus Endolissoclinum faulkneri L2 TaxID=1193729 RepID=K7ZDN3_9PROT|nr:hypothetical protein A1OE_1512 [Candidatus Endolissoclinum faulkneri L2]
MHYFIVPVTTFLKNLHTGLKILVLMYKEHYCTQITNIKCIFYTNKRNKLFLRYKLLTKVFYKNLSY